MMEIYYWKQHVVIVLGIDIVIIIEIFIQNWKVLLPVLNLYKMINDNNMYFCFTANLHRSEDD